MSRYPELDGTLIARVGGTGPFVTGDNVQLYQHYFAKLLGVATTRYQWLGLGPHIDPMRVEYLLCTQGLAAFTFVRESPDLSKFVAYDEPNDRKLAIATSRFAITRAMVSGYLDDTFTPAEYTTYAPGAASGITFNTRNPNLHKWGGVPIWGDANRSMYDANTIALFAGRLAQAALVVDTNLRNTTQSTVIVTDQDKLVTSRVALENAMTGADTFVNDKGVLDAVKVLNLGVDPRNVETSHSVMMRLWAEALEALGVQSPVAEKRERMITDEATGSKASVDAIRRLTLVPRQRAASLINRRYFSGQPVVEVVDQAA